MKSLIFMLLCSLILASCERGFAPIDYGKDACVHCKMTIVDNRYACELVTSKGRAYKFDDVSCMKRYIDEQQVADGSQYFIEDYLNRSANPLSADKSIYLQHDFFESPMNGNYAAFASVADAKPFIDSLKLSVLSWGDIK